MRILEVGLVLKTGKHNIYRPRSKGDNTFGSVRPSVCVFVQDLSVFANNQETFAIKSCAQQSGAFYLLLKIVKIKVTQCSKLLN